MLNIQDSVAVATETKAALWRTSGPDVLKFIPSEFDNRRSRPKQQVDYSVCSIITKLTNTVDRFSLLI